MKKEEKFKQQKSELKRFLKDEAGASPLKLRNKKFQSKESWNVRMIQNMTHFEDDQAQEEMKTKQKLVRSSSVKEWKIGIEE